MQSRLAPKEDCQRDGRIVVGAGNWSAGIDGSHKRQSDRNRCHLSRGGHGQLDGKDKDERACQLHDGLAEFAPKVLHDCDRCEEVIMQENKEPYQDRGRILLSSRLSAGSIMQSNGRRAEERSFHLF